MLYITKQLKTLVNMFITNSFSAIEASSSMEESGVKDSRNFKDALNKSLEDNIISKEEARALLEDFEWEKNNRIKYTRAAAKKLVMEFWVEWTEKWINKGSLKRMLREKAYQVNESINNQTSNNDSNVEDSIEAIKFERTLKQWVSSWEDVKLLQRYLGIEADWVFWADTKKTLISFQNTNKSAIGIRGWDWVMDLNWKTMNYIVSDINSKPLSEINDIYKDVQNGPEANDVVDNLIDVKTYLKAFNEIYGWKGEAISTHNGVLWAVMRMSESELTSLYNELSSKFWYVEDSTKQEFAKNLGLKEHSEKYEDGLRRMWIIALLSVVLSWGSSIALELFAINFWEDYSKWPEMEKIIKSLTGKEIEIKQKMESMYLSEKTTPQGIEEIFDILNDSEMDTANMRRYLEEVFQLNWFQKLFEAFIPDDYKEIQILIDKFQSSENVESWDSITRELHSKFKELTEKIKEKITDLEKELKEKESILAVDDDILEFTDRNTTANQLEETIKTSILSKENLAKVWDIAGRVQNLKAKKEQILWIWPDLIWMRLREKALDNELGLSKFNKISTKELLSEQSYGRKVDTSRLQEKGYMEWVLDSMKTETINWDTSVLSWVIRWIEQHYAISFTIEEFEQAYLNAEKVDNKETVSILSNTWRDHAQKFQWKIWKWELFKIDLNGTSVYFKDECNNIVTVAKDFDTTTLTTESMPVALVFWENGLLWKSSKSSWGEHSAFSNVWNNWWNTINIPKNPSPVIL